MSESPSPASPRSSRGSAPSPRKSGERESDRGAREDDHVRFSLDLNEVRALLLDYFARDLWPVVEHPPGGVNVHLIIADRSDSYSRADRERASRIAASNSQVTADVLPGGHWLHVDNPDGVVGKLLDYIKNA